MKINLRRIRRARLSVGVVFLICAGLLVWKTYSARTPDARIRKTLRALSHAASKAEGDGTASLVLKTRTINELFAPETSLDLRPSSFNGTYTPEEISSAMVKYRSLFASSKFELKDIEVTLQAPDRATAEGSAGLTGWTKDGEWINEVRDVVCELRLIDDAWKVSGIRIREILEK